MTEIQPFPPTSAHIPEVKQPKNSRQMNLHQKIDGFIKQALIAKYEKDQNDACWTKSFFYKLKADTVQINNQRNRDWFKTYERNNY